MNTNLDELLHALEKGKQTDLDKKIDSFLDSDTDLNELSFLYAKILSSSDSIKRNSILIERLKSKISSLREKGYKEKDLLNDNSFVEVGFTRSVRTEIPMIFSH